MIKNELIAGSIIVLMMLSAAIVMGGVIGAFIGAAVTMFRVFT